MTTLAYGIVEGMVDFLGDIGHIFPTIQNLKGYVTS
jgi:hypothetical protein